MINYLQYIYNNSLSAGYFPLLFKLALLHLIKKIGAQQPIAEKHRPISLLEVHGKLYDSILNRRTTDFFEDNNLTNERQHGFRRSRGTNTALAVLYETIANKLNDGAHVDVVLRDVSKAFDKVWHNGLKYKIFQTNLHDCYKRSLANYLDQREAKERINSLIGEAFPLETGVP